MNYWDQMETTLDEARAIQNAADSHATRMARMLRGRLRHVNRYVLEDLKRELRNFNMHTGRWND